MITPTQIKQKALKLWDNQSYLGAWVNQQSLHPIIITFPKVRGKQLVDQFAAMQQGINTLKQASKEHKQFGYRIEYEAINHRQLGTQQLPCRIFIDTEQDYLWLIGKQQVFAGFVKQVNETLTRWPSLQPLLANKPMILLKHAAIWDKLMVVCQYFCQQVPSGKYLRQLDIAGIDTKFIEQHRSILFELLMEILPQSVMDNQVAGVANHGFERRFGLLYERLAIRFRILDENISINGLTDISIPINEFSQLAINVDTVIITENKINGLCFPAMPRALVIFGLGYGVKSLQTAAWMMTKKIIYWGDIDTHGFAILSQLRAYFPQINSLMMDQETFTQFADLWVAEPQDKRFTSELQNLTAAEQALYQRIVNNTIGDCVRLEQERIPFGYVEQQCRLIDA